MIGRFIVASTLFLFLSCVWGPISVYYTDDLKEVQKMKQDTAIRVLNVEQRGEGSVKIWQIEYVPKKTR